MTRFDIPYISQSSFPFLLSVSWCFLALEPYYMRSSRCHFFYRITNKSFWIFLLQETVLECKRCRVCWSISYNIMFNLPLQEFVVQTEQYFPPSCVAAYVQPRTNTDCLLPSMLLQKLTSVLETWTNYLIIYFATIVLNKLYWIQNIEVRCICVVNVQHSPHKCNILKLHLI